MSSYTNVKIDNKDILSREARFVIPLRCDRDLHLVKEKVILKDGREIHRINILEDFKMPVYVTKPHLRTYQQKRERAKLEDVDVYMTTRKDKDYTIAKALKQEYLLSGKDTYNARKKLYSSPYVYGTDYDHASYIKLSYMRKYDTFTPYRVAVFDIETDMINNTNKTVIATLSFKDKVVTAITKDYLKKYPDAESLLRDKFEYYLGDIRKERNIDWIVKIVDNAGECVKEVFKYAHQWSPDVIAIWNMNFDIPTVLKDLEDSGIDAKDVFSDPFVPPDARFAWYKEGPAIKVKADGKKEPLKPAKRWHAFYAPASFYITDAMCVYYCIRMAQQDEPSYALDYILNKELGIKKLKFTEADHIRSNTPMWHEFMQKNYPLEYVIYNVFDCISIELLDEKTFDISVAMQSRLKTTPPDKFNSEPRRGWDNVYRFMTDRGYVPGTTMGIETELDALQVDRLDWISTLPAHLVPLKKSPYYAETNEAYTRIRVHCADTDVSAAYPNNTVALNISKETTSQELLTIEGVDNFTRKKQGMNFTGGHSNAIEIASELFKLPGMLELGKIYEHSTGRKPISAIPKEDISEFEIAYTVDRFQI